MAKINGIGGIFLNLEGNEKELRDWYRDVLGVMVSEYGVNFYSRMQFTILTFKRENDNSAIINFTVDNIEEMLNQLRKKEVKVVKEIENYSYGKFAQIEDILGNVIELWEPMKKEYEEMINKEVASYNSE